MRPLPRATTAPELLDEPKHDTTELTESLEHVAAVNRWLGGVSAVLRHLAPLVEPGTRPRILDLGTASADLPRHVARWARRRQQELQIVATDLHPQMREIATRLSRAFPEITVGAADARELPYADKSFDIVLLSLTLHHFDEPEQLRILREAARVAATAVVVNELRRTRLNYAGAKLLSWTFWRGNRLTRHDGPLSVLRAFTPAELAMLARKAGLKARVYTHYFQRVVLLIDA